MQDLRSDLAEFIAQTDDLVLVLSCSDLEVPYIAKTLNLVEADRAGDLFLVFAEPVRAQTDAHAYVDAILGALEAQRTGLNALRDAAGQPPWPPLPSPCEDRKLAPADRLEAALQWVRDQLPDVRHRIVFGFLPAEVRNPVAYVSVVRPLMPARELPPWAPGCRLIVRDDANQPVLVPHLDENPSSATLVYEGLDLSPEALNEALQVHTADADAPEDERMNSLIQLAALDHAHRRYPESLRKWGVVFAYYDQRSIAPMQALALCGAADVLRATAQLPAAKTTYQHGLSYVERADHLPVTLNLLVGAGEACIALEQWAEGEAYLSLAQTVARSLRQPYTECDVMARRGVAQLALDRTADAFATLRACADVSWELGYQERGLEALGLLQQLRRRAGDAAGVAAVDAEIATLRQTTVAPGGSAPS